jgi:anti-sigma regulatory factor (Ser/Thr protein kinase)
MTEAEAERSEVALDLPVEPSSVTIARRAVRALCDRVGGPGDDVSLAVSEAVGNAVMHAFRGRKSGTINVHAAPQRDMLVVTVTDDGGGMVPGAKSPGLGVGLSLISQVSHDVRLQSSKTGTIVSMSFVLEGGEAR